MHFSVRTVLLSSNTSHTEEPSQPASSGSGSVGLLWQEIRNKPRIKIENKEIYLENVYINLSLNEAPSGYINVSFQSWTVSLNPLPPRFTQMSCLHRISYYLVFVLAD